MVNRHPQNSKKSRKQPARTRRLPKQSQQAQSKVHHYVEKESYAILRGVHLKNRPHLLLNDLVSRSIAAKLAQMTSIHQRWRFKSHRYGGSSRSGLSFSYQPNVGPLYNGRLAFSATADLDVVNVLDSDVVNYVESGGPHESFSVSQRKTYSVPAGLLRGTETAGGWFVNSPVSKPTAEIGPCRVLLFQMGDVSTPADAEAIESLDILGTIDVIWSVECELSKALPHHLLATGHGFTGSPSEAPVQDSSVDPSTALYSFWDYTMANSAAPDSTEDTFTTLKVRLTSSEISAAGCPNHIVGEIMSKFPGGLDCVELIGGGGSNWNLFTDSEYEFGVDVTSYNKSGQAYRTEDDTWRLMSYMQSGTNKRDITDWIINSVKTATDFLLTDRGGWSIWDVSKDLGVLLLSAVALRERSDQQIFNEALGAVMLGKISDLSIGGNLLATHALDLFHHAQSMPGAKPVFAAWPIGPRPGNSWGYTSHSAVRVLLTPEQKKARGRVQDSRIAGRKSTSRKWMTNVGGENVFYPGTSAPPIQNTFQIERARAIPVSTKPLQLTAAASGCFIAEFSAFSGGPLLEMRLLPHTAPGVVAAPVDFTTFPVYDRYGNVIDTVDVDNGAYGWVLHYQSVADVLLTDDYAAEAAIDPMSPAEYLADILNNEDYGGVPNHEHASLYHCASDDTFDSDVLTLVSEVTGLGSTVIDWADFTSLPVTRAIYGYCQIYAVPLIRHRQAPDALYSIPSSRSNRLRLQACSSTAAASRSAVTEPKRKHEPKPAHCCENCPP